MSKLALCPVKFEINLGNISWPYRGNEGMAFFDFQHHCFAATRDPHPDALTGIHIGTYQLRMWTDWLIHEKQWP